MHRMRLSPDAALIAVRTSVSTLGVEEHELGFDPPQATALVDGARRAPVDGWAAAITYTAPRVAQSREQAPALLDAEVSGGASVSAETGARA